ncbi:MAG: enoyl-CoA hydratase/isomerase family protein, partial [Methanobacteriota archaeon]
VIMRGFYNRFLHIRELPIPVLAAINGPAIGAGLCFALAADMRLAAKSAKMGVTFVGLGLHPGMGATYFLPRLVGPQLAARLTLTGEVVSGEEAAHMGLVLEAVEDEELMPRTMALAAKIASQAPVAVRSCVRSLRMQHDEGMDRALWREADAQSYCYSGPDLKEGVASIAAKRQPVFGQYEQYKP